MFHKTNSHLRRCLASLRSSKHEFSDGTKLTFQHRYALRYFSGHKYTDIGFEDGVSQVSDRVIHEWSARDWYDKSSGARIAAVSEDERREISKKVETYCLDRGWTYEIVISPPDNRQ